MRIPLLVPDLGSGLESIRLSGWLVDEGELVLAGEGVAELLIPGFTFEVAAVGTGRMVEFVKAIDSELAVGDLLGWLEVDTPDGDLNPE